MEILRCKICPMESGISFHHEVPRAYGGTKGPQTPLCSGHHSLVHNLALELYSTRNEGTLRIPPDVAVKYWPELMRLVRTIVIARDRYEKAKKSGAAPRQGSMIKVSGPDMEKIDRIKAMFHTGQAGIVSLAINRLYDSAVKKK